MTTIDEKQARERLKKGWIRAIVAFEVAGRPKEHVAESLTQYLANIRKDSRIAILQEEREEVTEHEDGMFSTFAEVEMVVQDLETFTWLCMNFSPASIEILEPDSITVETRDLTNWLNDLLAKLHEVGTDYRAQKASKEHLTVAMNALIKNAILLAVRGGDRTPKDLERDIGIGIEQLQPFLTHLIEKGKLADRGNAYGIPDATAKAVTPKKGK